MIKTTPVAYFIYISFIFALAILWAPSAQAAPEFALPVQCNLEADCWIVNYMDVEAPAQTAQDFKCGPRTYDGHKGTDFALRDLVRMETGVSVLAAASGRVLRIRDGVEDEILSRAALDKINAEKRGCGNGVFIDHGNGWKTIYCHMKKDSLRVKQGQNVSQGQIIGQVGHSGFVEFPHLHLGVFFENTPIDPFTGHDDTEGCGYDTTGHLWKSDADIPTYRPLSVYAGGFKSHVPDFDAIKIDASGTATIDSQSTALVFWAGLYGAQKGDHVYLEIRAPNGQIFAKREHIQKQNRTRQFYYIGKRTDAGTLQTGQYNGHIQIYRNKERHNPLSIEKNFAVTIE